MISLFFFLKNTIMLSFHIITHAKINLLAKKIFNLTEENITVIETLETLPVTFKVMIEKSKYIVLKILNVS